MKLQSTLVGFCLWSHFDKLQRNVLVEQVLQAELEEVGATGHDLCLALTIGD